MSMHDPISDMLTIIRNGQMAMLPEVTMPSSKLKLMITKVLKDEGYIADYSVNKDGNKATLTLVLKYFNGKPVISGIKRVSRPGWRVYKPCKDLPEVLGGLGVAIISTSKGVLTDHAARAKGLGGEVLCVVE